jgi:hypothetical protein
MTEITDEDVTAVVAVLDESWLGYEDGARRILAAVAPAIYERGYSDGTLSLIRRDKEMYEQGKRDALREAADHLNIDAPLDVAVVISWLRARADAEREPLRDCGWCTPSHGDNWDCPDHGGSGARADAEDMPESVFPAIPGAANVALDDDRHWQRYIDGNHCAECAKYVDEGDAAW